MLEFKYPHMLWLIPVWLVFVYFLIYRNGWKGMILFPSISRFKGKTSGRMIWLRKSLLSLLYAALFCTMIIALARPRKANVTTLTPEEGVDIILAIDVSGSMRAEDFQLRSGTRLNRLEIVKGVVSDFIKKRQSDRIGLIVFAGYAFTQCPLTVDYDVLNFLLDEAEIGMIEDGTAIGSAIASSVKRLKDVKSKSKIVIFLTDGMNTAGAISPETAMELAKEENIKFYTIGVGSHEAVPYPVIGPFGQKRYIKQYMDMDEELLKKIAVQTGGQYFLAADTKSLEKIYETIDKLEKTTREVKHFTHYHELFLAWLKAACLLLLMITVLENTVFLKIP